VIGRRISGSCTPASAARTASSVGANVVAVTGTFLAAGLSNTSHATSQLRSITSVPDPALPTALESRRRPAKDELSAWRNFLRAHAHVTRALERELLAEQQLSLAAYDVLVQLAEAPGRQLRMTDLAEAVLLSRSGVTRLVDRLEQAGLVARERTSDDGRGVVAVLTEDGLQRLRIAARTHLDGVVRHFVARLQPDELAEFGRISARLFG
jgi:DNA-binding MarR family transcriptional regulator